MFLRQFALILLLVPLFSRPGFGETLYERSTAQLAAKALQANPADYTFVVLGDSRAGDRKFRQALSLAKTFHPLFIFHGGDYSERGGKRETAKFLRLLKESVPDMPVFVVKGNHEKNSQIFAREIGPLNFTVESKRLGLTLIAVDNSKEKLKGAELDYLKSRLSSAAGSVFVAMHIPPKSERWDWHTFAEGAAELKSILATSRVQASFFFHMHLFDSSEFGGAPAFVSGGAGSPLHVKDAPGEPVHHILVVRVKNGKASVSKVLLP